MGFFPKTSNFSLLFEMQIAPISYNSNNVLTLLVNFLKIGIHKNVLTWIIELLPHVWASYAQRKQLFYLV